MKDEHKQKLKQDFTENVKKGVGMLDTAFQAADKMLTPTGMPKHKQFGNRQPSDLYSPMPSAERLSSQQSRWEQYLALCAKLTIALNSKVSIEVTAAELPLVLEFGLLPELRDTSNLKVMNIPHLDHKDK